MSILLAILGTALVLFTLSDVVRTALLSHGGPLTKRLGSSLWRGALRLHRRTSSRTLLTFAGVAILLVTVVVWELLLWAGWTLIFSADGGSIVSSSGNVPADLGSKIYFVGYALVTLGNGDYKPNGAFWKLITVVASGTGFFLITLAITFLFSVVTAAVATRQAAVYISSLGETPTDIVARSWDGHDCQALTRHLTTLMTMIGSVGQQHRAFPVLHYLHSADRATALPLKVAVLDEGLHYLIYGVQRRCGLGEAELRPLRRIIGEYLKTLSVGFLDEADESPPAASLEPLRNRGIPTASDAAFETALQGEAKRRRLLLALVERDGWRWHDVYLTTATEVETPSLEEVTL